MSELAAGLTRSKMTQCGHLVPFVRGYRVRWKQRQQFRGV